MELEIRREIMESVRPVFECKTCKAFPTIKSVNVYGQNYCSYHGTYHTCMKNVHETKVLLQPKCRNGHDTGKSLSEALLFAEHWGEQVVYKICPECQKQFLYATCSPLVLA